MPVLILATTRCIQDGRRDGRALSSVSGVSGFWKNLINGIGTVRHNSYCRYWTRSISSPQRVLNLNVPGMPLEQIRIGDSLRHRQMGSDPIVTADPRGRIDSGLISPEIRKSARRYGFLGD